MRDNIINFKSVYYHLLIFAQSSQSSHDVICCRAQEKNPLTYGVKMFLTKVIISFFCFDFIVRIRQIELITIDIKMIMLINKRKFYLSRQ